jgi:RNA-binding protein PNO1
MNIKSRAIELKTSKHTTDPSSLQRAQDFCQCFALGFDIEDAIALLKLDDL